MSSKYLQSVIVDGDAGGIKDLGQFCDKHKEASDWSLNYDPKYQDLGL